MNALSRMLLRGLPKVSSVVLMALAPSACAHNAARTIPNESSSRDRADSLKTQPQASSPAASPASGATSSTLPVARAPAPSPRSSSAVGAAGPVETAAAPSMVYALVVSFGSECCGTDQNAVRALERLLSVYPPDALGCKSVGWGEEGEYDLCFTLAGLSPAQRRRLTSDAKTKIRSKLVSVNENAACNHGPPL